MIINQLPFIYGLNLDFQEKFRSLSICSVGAVRQKRQNTKDERMLRRA